MSAPYLIVKVSRAVYGRDKFLADTISAIDAAFIEMQKAFADQLGMADHIGLGAGKNLADVLTASDALQLLTVWQRTFEDAITASESVVFATHKQLADTITIADSTALSFGKGLADQLAMADVIQIIIGFNPTFADSMSMSDSPSVQTGFARTFDDSISMSDVIQVVILGQRFINGSAINSTQIN